MTRIFNHRRFRRAGASRLVFGFLAVLLFLLGSSPVLAVREIVVREGESLSLIAQRELGDMERWTELARLNGITDPRRLQAGQRLALPGGDEAMSGGGEQVLPAVAHVMGVPSLRRNTGAVRVRAASGGGWSDLMAATRLEPGLAVMTANTGRADFLAGDLSGELGPFSVVTLAELMDEPRRARIRIDLGDISLRSSRTAVHVEARAGRVLLEAGEVRIQVDATGTLKLTVIGGSATVIGLDGQRVPVPAGSVATARVGGGAEVAASVGAVRLLSPADGAVLVERDVQFTWEPVSGARGYLLHLVPLVAGQPELRQEVANPSLEVRGVPEGEYSWRVTPRGVSDAAPSPTARFRVNRSAPDLALNPPALEAGRWVLRGRTVAGARLSAGSIELVADDAGDFLVDLGPLEGLTVVGVEARVGSGGAVARAAIAIAGRVPSRQCPVAVLVPRGRVLLGGEPAAEFLDLSDGANRIAWAWEHDGARVAAGTLALELDLTPPEILAIRSAPEQVGADQEVAVFVKARDRGTGLAGPQTATLTVEGPDSASMTLTATDLTAAGEYRFVFRTPARLTRGLYRVTRLEVADRDGNAVLLETRGTVVEARGAGTTPARADDAPTTHRQLLKDIFLIGIGALLGSL